MNDFGRSSFIHHPQGACFISGSSAAALSKPRSGRTAQKELPTFFSDVESVGGNTSQVEGTSPLIEGIVESVQDGL